MRVSTRSGTFPLARSRIVIHKPLAGDEGARVHRRIRSFPRDSPCRGARRPKITEYEFGFAFFHQASTLLHVWTAPGAQGLLLDLARGTSAVMCPAFDAVHIDRWPRWVSPNKPQTRIRPVASGRATGVGGDPFHQPWLPAVPFKLNADRRHHIPKQRHRVANWAEYDAALRQCASLTVWFTDAAIAAWRAEPRTTRGGQPHYSALAITTALTLRSVFRLALRQTEGLIGSIIRLLGLDLAVPDHSTLT